MTRQYNTALSDQSQATKEVADATEKTESRVRILKGTTQLTKEELQEVRREFDELVESLNSVVDEAFSYDVAMLNVREKADELSEALRIQNHHWLDQLEREGALTRASQNYANAMAGISEELIGMPLEEINGFFDEQETMLDKAFKSGELAAGEYERLTQVLRDLEQQVMDLNNVEALIKIGVDTRGVSQDFINSMFTGEGEMDLEGFGAGVSGFLGGGSPSLPSGGSGGNSTNTVVNVNMPAGVDGQTVVDAIETYARENGSAPIATTTLVRQ